MCAVTIYRDNEILMKDVAEYEFDVKNRVLIAYTIEGMKEEFKDIKYLRWNEMNDKLIFS